MQRPRRGGSGLGSCLERQKAVGFGDAEVFILKYNSRDEDLAREGSASCEDPPKAWKPIISPNLLFAVFLIAV